MNSMTRINFECCKTSDTNHANATVVGGGSSQFQELMQRPHTCSNRSKQPPAISQHTPVTLMSQHTPVDCICFAPGCSTTDSFHLFLVPELSEWRCNALKLPELSERIMVRTFCDKFPNTRIKWHQNLVKIICTYSSYSFVIAMVIEGQQGALLSVNMPHSR